MKKRQNKKEAGLGPLGALVEVIRPDGRPQLLRRRHPDLEPLVRGIGRDAGAAIAGRIEISALALGAGAQRARQDAICHLCRRRPDRDLVRGARTSKEHDSSRQKHFLSISGISGNRRAACRVVAALISRSARGYERKVSMIKPLLIAVVLAFGVGGVAACGAKSGTGAVDYSVSAQKNYEKGLKVFVVLV